MSCLHVLTYPNDLLREKSTDVSALTETEKALIDNMVETMFKEKGVGLAAPQVGVLKKIIIAAPRGNDKELYVFINPTIKKTHGEYVDIEGCLSVPCASGEVKRAKKIWVEALDKAGKEVSFTATDFFARIIQHEADHLQGMLFIDHLGFDARKEAIDCTRKVRGL